MSGNDNALKAGPNTQNSTSKTALTHMVTAYINSTSEEKV
jgi:hypothetical protein